ncbi:hypothetical protein [Wolbachia endosymbiont (group A) of Campoletis raptor]
MADGVIPVLDTGMTSSFFGIPVQLLASANCNVRTTVGAKFYKHRCAEP